MICVEPIAGSRVWHAGLSIRVAGDVGQGTSDCALAIARGLVGAGWSVVTSNDAPARVRGGHTFQTIRARGDGCPTHAPRRGLDLLVAFTHEAVEIHSHQLAHRSVLVCPETVHLDEHQLAARGVAVVRVREALHATESSLPAEAATAASRVLNLPAVDVSPPVLFATGNEAIAFGALVAGCRFIGVYPMTPATSIVEWLSALDPSFGITIVNAEDEIAAATMALGAAYAGARTMTVTSGGGLALMAESVGFAAMSEIPIVIVDAQRPGPSTGMPTRTEQGDLLFAVHLAQGDVPHIVLAPRDVADCFEQTVRAFNLADQFQCPVIILTDGHLATTRATVAPEAMDPVTVRIHRGSVRKGAARGYERYAPTLEGISPRAWPGDPYGVHTASSYEHDRTGHIEESAENRVASMDRRADRLELARAVLRGPERYGPAVADVTLVTWGSTAMACREAADLAAANGACVNVLEFTDLWPFPAEAAARALGGVQRAVLVEQNATGQLATLLRAEAGIDIPARCLAYDGRAVLPEEVLERAVPIAASVRGLAR